MKKQHRETKDSQLDPTPRQKKMEKRPQKKSIFSTKKMGKKNDQALYHLDIWGNHGGKFQADPQTCLGRVRAQRICIVFHCIQALPPH